jgi:hypothetical protein
MLFSVRFFPQKGLGNFKRCENYSKTAVDLYRANVGSKIGTPANTTSNGKD